MKTIVAVLALCCVAINAAVVQQPINYETRVNDIIQEAGQIAIDTAEALEQQYEGIVVAPLQQVDEALQGIEQRKEENEACVAAEQPTVAAVVDEMHNEMNVCGVVAAKTSAQIMVDVSAATQQIIFDGYDVLTTYNKCKSYKNSILKNSCYAKLSIKATLYLKNARKSINTIKESTFVRVPAVFADAETCTTSAANVAIFQLEHIHVKIDMCLTK